MEAKSLSNGDFQIRMLHILLNLLIILREKGAEKQIIIPSIYRTSILISRKLYGRTR